MILTSHEAVLVAEHILKVNDGDVLQRISLLFRGQSLQLKLQLLVTLGLGLLLLRGACDGFCLDVDNHLVVFFSRLSVLSLPFNGHL